MEGATIRLLGVGDQPIVLSPDQLRGNRSLLLSNPAAVRLDIRQQKRTNRDADTPPEWRVHRGKSLPEADNPSPTVFQNVVYATYQHAMLALLLWTGGGMTGAFQVRHYPRGPLSFPHFVVDNHSNMVAGGPAHDEDDSRGMAIHLLHQEPGPSTMAALASSMLEVAPPLAGCVLLVGTLRATAHRSGGVDSPQLRGILLRSEHVPPPGRLHTAVRLLRPVPPVLPREAVSHGWHLHRGLSKKKMLASPRLTCLQQGTLCLALHGQHNDNVLPGATLPAFSAVGYRLWCKGQSTFAVAVRTVPAASSEWDALPRVTGTIPLPHTLCAIRSFLQANGD